MGGVCGDFVLRTPRLCARPARQDGRDVGCLLRLWNDPRVMAPVGFPEGLGVTADDVRADLARHGDSLLGAVLIVELHDGEFVGQARMAPLDAAGVCETDLKIVPERQREGLATELKQAMFAFLFGATRCECVRTLPSADNAASLALQRRVHARVVGAGRFRLGPDAAWRPYYVCELRRDEWLALQRSGEWRAIARSPRPLTRASLAAELAELGLGEGDLVLLHSSLSALGWVCGGEHAVLLALFDVLGADGTLVVPAHSSEHSDPAGWNAPPVPRAWWETIRRELPAFDPARTPVRGMGRIADAARRWPGAVRSAHPSGSFAAIGPLAERICAGHAFAAPFGESSPLARLYELDADVLLLGAGWDSCTCLHLAEHRAGRPLVATAWAAHLEDGVRHWRSWREPDYDVQPFTTIGADFEAEHAVSRGRIGLADTRLFSLREAVDFAAAWLRTEG